MFGTVSRILETPVRLFDSSKFSFLLRAYIQEAFCVFGGDGIVTKNYLKLSMLNSGQTSSSEVQEMLDTLDTDNDGKVQLEDFMR